MPADPAAARRDAEEARARLHAADSAQARRYAMEECCVALEALLAAEQSAPEAPPALPPEVREAAEALAPFAEYGMCVDPHVYDDAPIGNNLKPYLTFGDVRRAAAIYAKLSALAARDGGGA